MPFVGSTLDFVQTHSLLESRDLAHQVGVQFHIWWRQNLRIDTIYLYTHVYSQLRSIHF